MNRTKLFIIFVLFLFCNIIGALADDIDKVYAIRESLPRFFAIDDRNCAGQWREVQECKKCCYTNEHDIYWTVVELQICWCITNTNLLELNRIGKNDEKDKKVIKEFFEKIQNNGGECGIQNQDPDPDTDTE